MFLVASKFDVFERLSKWFETHDSWQGDEIISVLVLLPFALGVFAWRRWKELRAEADRRQLAEESVRVGEESYRQLVDSAEDVIYRTDARGRFILCNPALLRLLKYSEAELLGLNYLQVIRPDQQQAAKEFYERQFTARAHSTYHEFTAVSQDGQEILVGQNVQLIIQNGSVAGFQAVARDITERQRAEDAVRKMEEYRNLFKLANDSILIIDAADGTVLDVNDKAGETYGLTREEFIGHNILELVQDPARATHCLREIAGEGRISEFETTHIRADGTPIHFLINPSLIEYQGRRAILSVNRDITERKQAEEEQQLLQTERDQLLEQLQLQIEVMPNAFVLADAAYRTTYWNPAAERIFGFTKAEILGTQSHKLLVPVESQAFVEGILDQIAAGESLSSSFSDNVTKDGRRITCEWYTAPLKKADGTFLGIMSMAQDITERVRAQQALQEANQRALNDYERLVERIATLGQTVGNARDLTTIFRALRDFALVSVPCDGMVISLYEEEKQTRRPTYCWADQTEFDPKGVVDVPVRDGMTGRSIKSGSVIIDNDFQQELRVKTRVMIGECIEGSLPRSAMTAPMTVMGRTVGCVEIQSYQKGAFGADHATAMRMAANLAATAVENVTLIERERIKEEQLRQSQKMDSIGQLAGGVAHDFNNLLTAITGYSDLALRKLPEDASVRKHIEEIKKGGPRL